MPRKITIRTKVQEIPIEDYDEKESFELPNTYDSEIMIMSLKDPKETQVLLLRFMGYNYKEITKIMHLRNIGEFYFLWTKLKEDFQKLSEI